MFAKLKSRKLWATVAGVAFAAFGSQFGVPEITIAKVTYLIMAYVGGQAIVDAALGTSSNPPQ